MSADVCRRTGADSLPAGRLMLNAAKRLYTRGTCGMDSGVSCVVFASLVCV